MLRLPPHRTQEAILVTFHGPYSRWRTPIVIAEYRLLEVQRKFRRLVQAMKTSGLFEGRIEAELSI